MATLIIGRMIFLLVWLGFFGQSVLLVGLLPI